MYQHLCSSNIECNIRDCGVLPVKFLINPPATTTQQLVKALPSSYMLIFRPAFLLGLMK